MNKYLLSILAAGTITSVSYATPVGLDLWEFDDAAGLSFGGSAVDAAAGFANTGSNGSLWNYGGFSAGASTDGTGNLVLTGKTGAVYRKLSTTYSPVVTTGVYRLSLDISSWNMSAGSMLFDATGGPTGATRVAALKLDNSEATEHGCRLSCDLLHQQLVVTNSAQLVLPTMARLLSAPTLNLI